MDIPEEDRERYKKQAEFQQMFEDWVLEVRPRGLTVMDAIALIIKMIMRIRQALLFPEVHEMIHNAMFYVEERIEQWEKEEDDGSQDLYVVAEKWRFRDDAVEVAKSLSDDSPIPDTIPEDWKK